MKLTIETFIILKRYDDLVEGCVKLANIFSGEETKYRNSLLTLLRLIKESMNGFKVVVNLGLVNEEILEREQNNLDNYESMLNSLSLRHIPRVKPETAKRKYNIK